MKLSSRTTSNYFSNTKTQKMSFWQDCDRLSSNSLYFVVLVRVQVPQPASQNVRLFVFLLCLLIFVVTSKASFLFNVQNVFCHLWSWWFSSGNKWHLSHIHVEHSRMLLSSPYTYGLYIWKNEGKRLWFRANLTQGFWLVTMCCTELTAATTGTTFLCAGRCIKTRLNFPNIKFMFVCFFYYYYYFMMKIFTP